MVEVADLVGRWSLVRQIDDRRAGQAGLFEGEASFAPRLPESGALIYREAGWLRLGSAAPLWAERSYIWRFSPEEVAVDHADGRPFHSFAHAAPQGEHLCGDDRYRVAYDFSALPIWSARWRVTGPRKDYVMDSRYRRAA